MEQQEIAEEINPELVEISAQIHQQVQEALNESHLDAEFATTILEVLGRNALRTRLIATGDPTVLTDFSVDDPAAIERLRLECMGVWLEETNGSAINAEGQLLVTINNGVLELSPEIEELDQGGKLHMLLRQGIIRQIERDAVFQANGIFNLNQPQAILDVGAGTLIGSVMCHHRYPEAHITALEPGYVSQQSLSIATKVPQITLQQKHLEMLPEDQKYDAILLHFVLEHDIHESKELIAEALKRLEPHGVISIAVPNALAFHRDLETQVGMNQRDADTKLSLHDHLSGHQIIFDQAGLMQLIEEVMNETGIQKNIQTQTILPRPFAFNTLCAMNEHKALLELEQSGHIPGMEEQGSVLCITIGNGQQNITPTNQNSVEIFQRIIDKFCAQENKSNTAERVGEYIGQAF